MTQIRTFLSTTTGVGKTTAVLHLGAALVRLGRRVTLVDADPARGLCRACGIDPPGGTPPSGGPATLAAVHVVSTTLPGFVVISPAAGPQFSLRELTAANGTPPDWVLVDAGPGVPPAWTLPPAARAVVCTDAGGEEPALVEALLSELERLRQRHPVFLLDRILFTRLDWASRERWENARAWTRALGPEGGWRTQLRLDRSFTLSTIMQRVRLADPRSRLGQDAVHLALEWLSSPEAGEEGFVHVDSLV